MLGGHCCAQAFSSCDEQRLFFAGVHRLIIVVASLAAEQGSSALGLQQLPHMGSAVAALRL